MALRPLAGHLTRFTFEGNANQNPAWTPDGKRIALRSNKEGPRNIFWQPSPTAVEGWSG